MAKTLTLDQMYEECILDIKLPIEKNALHPMQERQLKNMFYAAIGNFTQMVKEIAQEHTPDEQEVILDGIDKELKEFWKPKIL